MHVFGPPDRYRGASGRTCTPSLKPMDEYRRVSERLGLRRVVLIQPSAYGTDNRCLFDTMRAGSATMRAIVVIGETADAAALEIMHRIGVRGIRLNLTSPRITDTAAARALLERAASQVAPRGWHVQIYCDGEILSVVAPALHDLPAAVVFDHMGGASSRSMPACSASVAR
jgi:2-pyrone-4,6-dicarboxylate lactonase